MENQDFDIRNQTREGDFEKLFALFLFRILRDKIVS